MMRIDGSNRLDLDSKDGLMNKVPMDKALPITHITFSTLGGAGAVAARLAAAQRKQG